MELNKELGGGPCGQKEEHGHGPRGRRELSELEELLGLGEVCSDAGRSL